MTIEDDLLQDFRAMDDETQTEARLMFRNLARDFPRAPRLKIVRSAQISIIARQPPGDGPQPFPAPFGK